MPLIGIYLILAIETCHFLVEKDVQFFFYAELTFTTHRGKVLGTVHQLPRNRVFNFSFFKVPDMIAK